MLFIIVMDILNDLLRQTESYSLLVPVRGQQVIPHRLSLYANDADLFLSPVASDLHTIKTILEVFGEASRLHSNLAKSSVSPIRCSEDHLQLIAEELKCARAFPCG